MNRGCFDLLHRKKVGDVVDGGASAVQKPFRPVQFQTFKLPVADKMVSAPLCFEQSVNEAEIASIVRRIPNVQVAFSPA